MFQDGLKDFADFVDEAITSEPRLLRLVIIGCSLQLSERFIEEFKLHLAKRLSILEKTSSAGIPWDSSES